MSGRRGGSTFVLLAGGIWLLARSRHINFPTTIVTIVDVLNSYVNLGAEKGRVQNLNSNPEVCHTNILIPESQVALVETSKNTTENRFRFCTHPGVGIRILYLNLGYGIIFQVWVHFLDLVT